MFGFVYSYATLYSEDSHNKETFAYRLNGFAKKPTDRYLRPFFRGANRFINELLSHSPRCVHQLELRFLKRFMKNYQDMPTFSLFVMNAGHDIYSNFKLFNDDLVDYNKFLQDTGIRDNTISVVLGDHGARSSKYRATMVGKLEERLPFMAFSFPPWFKTKFPNEFRNFQQNSNILTAHFDVYATLKHLFKFDQRYENNHKWGKSLFSDIAPLNRSCTDAGVKEHWCPCIDYESVDIKSNITSRVSSQLLKVINQKLKDNELSNQLCETVELSKIIRTQKVKTNAKVQQFSGSFRKGCDGCGIKLNREKKFTSDSYEIVVETKHGSALFEATLVVDRSNEAITINGDISRINMYGSQPNCIAKKAPHLRKFCYCKEQQSTAL